MFESLIHETRTMVFFESPHRIAQSLSDAVKVFGPDRKASVSRELTKKFEETKRGSLAELAIWAEDLKGEMVLVIAGAEAVEMNTAELVEQVLELKLSGVGLKQAASSVAKQYGVSSSELYALALKQL
jgi:16S rRNA (cytidine1402-2'-O)-methyltransferase